MARSLLKEERGYSLIEVMVSIIILALAILPMVGMFDMGLHGVTASSNYDKARAGEPEDGAGEEPAVRHRRR